MRIYEEYTSKIKSASHTDTLSHFAQKLCAKMGVIHLYAKKEDRKRILGILQNNDDLVLDLLRNDTQLVVCKMRETIDEKKDTGELDSLIAQLSGKIVDEEKGDPIDGIF